MVLGLVLILTSPTPLPPPLVEQEQDVETALYLAVFALILPAALIAVPRLADAIAARPQRRGSVAPCRVVVATLAAAILVVRVLPGGGGVVEALVVVGAWWVGAIACWCARRADAHGRGFSRSPTWRPSLGRWPARSSSARSWPSPLWGRSAPCRPRWAPLPSPLSCSCTPAATRACRPCLAAWGMAIDVVVIVLCLLAIPDLVIFEASSPFSVFTTNHVIQFHHNFFLGPVNEVLHGGAVLVDTASQYGVGSLYFLAGWFELAPIGYGTFGFLDGVLFALFFAAAYCVLRIAGTPRLLAGGALALGVIVLIYNLEYSVGSLPQHGPLRFGLPMVVILAAAAEAALARTCTPRVRRPALRGRPLLRSGLSKPSRTPPRRSRRSHAFGPGRSRGRGAWHRWHERALVAVAACAARSRSLRGRHPGCRRASCPTGASTSPT